MIECKPCPFCGMQIDPEDIDTLYPSGTGWIDMPFEEVEGGSYRHYVNAFAHEVPKDQWCYKIICNESYGGCAAEIHADSKQEAIEKWNKRV